MGGSRECVSVWVCGWGVKAGCVKLETGNWGFARRRRGAKGEMLKT